MLILLAQSIRACGRALDNFARELGCPSPNLVPRSLVDEEGFGFGFVQKRSGNEIIRSVLI